ncbi:hypothetical protein HPB47_010309 [Ixodes persulcatus]|uniref:Uncharacterized protein n=1 Tax=Ixodes persulcatus TaxID=34615 RepID=A0AC60NZS8_IXOPE|nr:hypothetical protein HPB47_010309 [Ixodes persulcatus]
MTESKDVCGKCSAQFFGRQQFLACSGICTGRFHCKCLNVEGDDYGFYMSSGVSTYKCASCTKRRDPDSAGILDSVPIVVSASTDGKDRVGPDATGQCACGLGGLVTALVRGVDELVSTVHFLRDDNAVIQGDLQKLSLQLSELTLAVPDAIDFSETTESRRAYIKVARSAVSSARRPQLRNKLAAPSSAGHRQNTAGPPTLAAPSSSDVKHAEVLDKPAMGTRSSITANFVRRQEWVRARTHLYLLCLDHLPDVPCSSRGYICLLHVKS